MSKGWRLDGLNQLRRCCRSARCERCCAARAPASTRSGPLPDLHSLRRIQHAKESVASKQAVADVQHAHCKTITRWLAAPCRSALCHPPPPAAGL